MIRYFIVALVGISIAYATPSGGLNEGNLKAILVKMKNNDPLSNTEKTEFSNAVQHIESKIASAGGKKTTLTTIETQVNNQQKINQITPTIHDLLEKGKQYPWGLDLDLVEKRGKAIRSGQLGGEDVTSYISTFQKVNANPKDLGYGPALEKIKIVTKLPREILKKLPDWDTWLQVKSGTWFSQCPCLIQLINSQLKLLPTKRGVFVKEVLTRPEAYDKVNGLKIKSNQALAKVNKEMKELKNNPRLAEAVQAVRQMDKNCLKDFAELSNAIKKASKGKVVLEANQCPAKRVNRTQGN